jgi:uncharacterized protein
VSRFLHRGIVLLALLTTASLAAAATPDSAAKKTPAPSQPSEAVKERMIQTILRERQRTEEFLRYNAMSYLAAVQRVEFGNKKSLVVGRDADCDLRVDDPLFLPKHLRITVRGDSFHVQTLNDSATFRVDLREPRDTTLAPSHFSPGRVGELIGRYQIRMSHQNAPALIFFDARSPRLAAFRGLKYYPVNLKYRLTVPLQQDTTPDTVGVASTKSRTRKALRVGWFEFTIDGQPCRLEALRILEPGAPTEVLAVFFKDRTNGGETCAQGRYLDARPLGKSGNWLLDFNTAYNPACLFTEYYNCPLPPEANTLKVPIPVGEKDWKELTAEGK